MYNAPFFLLEVSTSSSSGVAGVMLVLGPRACGRKYRIKAHMVTVGLYF